MTVILLDMDARSALAALRSLKSAGIRVVCGAHRSDAFGLRSRYVDECFVYPSPLSNREAFIHALEEKIRQTDEHALLMSCSDGTAGAIHAAREHGLFAPNVVLPSVQNYRRAIDKQELANLAQTLGLPVPRSFGLEEVLQKPDCIADGLVVKPRISVTWQGGAAHKESALLVCSAEDLRLEHDRLLSKTGMEPLIQERLHGDEYGVSLLAVRGEIRALFAHRRLRSITAWGGASSSRESVPLTDEMRRIAAALVQALEWHGIMMIELKKGADEKLYLIEINARFWGSLPLALYAGIDFPRLLTEVHAKGDVRAVTSYHCHVRARHLVSDISHLYARGFRALPPFLLSFLRDHDDVWEWSDPMPSVSELMHFLKQRFIRRSGGRALQTDAKRLYLVRHAHYRVVSGLNHTEDSARHISRLGRIQSWFVGRRMRTLGCDALYASPFVRTQETAHIISRTTGLPVKTDPRLSEFMPSASLTGAEYKAARNAARHNPYQARTDGESFDASVRRLTEILDEITQDHRAACVVTHSQLIINFLHAHGRSTTGDSIRNASITSVERTPDGYIVRSVGDAPSLCERAISVFWHRTVTPFASRLLPKRENSMNS